ncbi:chemotaxis protein CheD [Paenibacillus wynnii]|uniref:chemotaxis protein CheD n=1 Tax=Paenibacillus wynnii TaxID=268407 RepID=UPI00278E1162|nr:chemotaxis protein CheD [Paenibacillus wynnii]MDQ0192452.1 chemotaxis protein CheD [Paenibacillus wynnii]
MTIKVVGIGEAAFSDNPKDTLKTYALSTCVAVTAYCSIHRVAGMVHIALPSPLYGNVGTFSVFRYASTGIPQVFDTIRAQCGCQARDLMVRIYGGAVASKPNDHFMIGPRNVEAVMQVLHSLNAKCHYEDTGGNISRTLEMNVTDGRINVTALPLAF